MEVDCAGDENFNYGCLFVLDYEHVEVPFYVSSLSDLNSI